MHKARVRSLGAAMIPLTLALLIALAALLAFAAIIYCAVAKCQTCGEFHADDNEERICCLDHQNKKGIEQ